MTNSVTVTPFRIYDIDSRLRVADAGRSQLVIRQEQPPLHPNAILTFRQAGIVINLDTVIRTSAVVIESQLDQAHVACGLTRFQLPYRARIRRAVRISNLINRADGLVS